MGRVKFDPTVNLGHIITATLFLFTASAGWATLDSRQTRLEERTVRLEQQRLQDDIETRAYVAATARAGAQIDAIQASVRRVETLLDRTIPSTGANR